jgi:hypothetical protein
MTCRSDIDRTSIGTGHRAGHFPYGKDPHGRSATDRHQTDAARRLPERRHHAACGARLAAPNGASTRRRPA